MGLSVNTAIKLSFGTSLMVILPTAASGTWRHHREKAVRWRAALIIGASAAAAFAGATLASYLPGETLKIIFGAAVITAAVRMLTQRVHETDEPPVNDPRLWAAWAIPIGLVSGLIGIGRGDAGSADTGAGAALPDARCHRYLAGDCDDYQYRRHRRLHLPRRDGRRSAPPLPGLHPPAHLGPP